MILILTAQSEVSARCTTGWMGNDTVVTIADPMRLCETARHLKPSLLLIDAVLVYPSQLHLIEQAKLVSPRSRILLLNVPADNHMEHALLRVGARGCCPPDASVQ